MRNFTYQALTKDEKLRTGEIMARSAAAALEELESQGLTVLLIRQAEGPVIEPLRSRPRVMHETTGEQILRERVAQLLEKRETLGPALAAFAEELPKGKARRELASVSRQIESGASVDELTQGPALTKTWLPLVGSDSTIGTSHLQSVLAEAERDYANRSYLARSLTYPAVLFGAALAVLLFLSIFVIPGFREIFDDFDCDLPWLTVFVVNFSTSLVHRPLQFFGILISAGLVLWGALTVLRRVILPSRWFGFFLNGNSQQVSEMADFVRHLAEALNAGMPLEDALLIVGSNSRHHWLRWEALRLYDNLLGGADRQTTFHNSALPATVNHALRAGPEGSPHVGLLQTIAETYIERVRNRVSWSTGSLPQVATLCVGLLVAMVVLALYLPLVTLIDGLTP